MDEKTKDNPRFVIHRKAFSITSEVSPVRLPTTEREIMFAHQRNATDCGPCLVLNTLSALEMPSFFDSVLGVRQQANELRANQHRPPLGVQDWFLTEDVADLLQEHGLNVEPYSIKSPVQETDFWQSLQQKISDGHSFVVYTGTGRHFKGVYSPDGKNYFLLDSQKDAIEELGFFGAGILLLVYFILIMRILKIAQNAEPLGKFLAVGLGMMLLGQVFINVGMNLGIVPVTGITLPLVSYGGSSILATMISLGIVENISHS